MKCISTLKAVARVLVGIVLLISSVSKASSPKDTTQGFREFGVPKRFAADIMRAVILSECTLGFGLVVPTRFRTLSASLASYMLGLFSLSIFGSRVVGNSGRCPCFGQSIKSLNPIASLSRNFVLIALTTDFRGKQSKPITLIPMMVSAVLIIAEAAFDRLKARTEHDHMQSCKSLGETFPRSDTVQTLMDQVEFSDDELFVVVFLSESCQPCSDLVEALATRESSSFEKIIFVAANCSHASLLKSILRTADLHVVIDESGSIGANLCVLGTPAALGINKEGKVIKDTLHGTENVLQMLSLY